VTTRSARTAAAAWALAAAAGLLALPGPAAAPAACARPAEQESAAGATSAVRCDGAGGPLRGAPRLLYGLRLDLNRADPRAFEALPGIGPARAAAIAAARPFRDPAELGRVPGLGSESVRALRPHVEVVP
jgi:hypothetical protein